MIAGVPLKAVFQRIHQILDTEAVNAVIFMGDFSDRGSIDGYDSCTRYIAEALELGEGRAFAKMPVGIVPGNHDIDRKVALEPGLVRKFEPLNRILEAARLPSLPVERPTSRRIGTAPAHLHMHLLNSCWGCGEPEFIPEAFRQLLSQAIASAISGPQGAAALAEYYDRQLDSPAFSLETIQILIDRLRESPGTDISMVVAHHNILPQRLTRLAPYTELVNSGALRGALLKVNRPIIYLHGHIHDDPIDIITAAPGEFPLVAVSAPEASKGFNIVEIVFTRLGMPLLCQVVPWRFDAGGILRPEERIKVPLLGRRTRSHGRPLSSLYSRLLERKESYWVDVLSIARGLSQTYTETELLEDIELLHADGHINVANYDLSSEHWLIGAAI